MGGNEELTINIKLSALALNLRRQRMNKGMTIKEVAARCGIRPDRLLRYETDQEIPPFQTIDVLADFFGVDRNDLLGD